MDVLSSQVNIAGYRAVIVAANHYQRFMPTLMTVAGTVKAARVLILGVDVARLQAIATAKRLDAVTEASDACPAVKEQIEPPGTKFLDVPFLTDEKREIAQGVGGHARLMPLDWTRRQTGLVYTCASQADIVITMAPVPGRRASTLLSETIVQAMKPDSVTVDLVAVRDDNYPLTEADRVVVRHGVMLVDYINLASVVAIDASALYARNTSDFLKLITDKDGGLNINREGDVVAACLLSQISQMVHAPAATSAAK